jgi:hypothetical protein
MPVTMSCSLCRLTQLCALGVVALSLAVLSGCVRQVSTQEHHVTTASDERADAAALPDQPGPAHTTASERAASELAVSELAVSERAVSERTATGSAAVPSGDRSTLPGDSAGEAARPAAAPPRVTRRPEIRRGGTGGALDITFDDLALEMPVGTLFTPELLTERVRELDGQYVRLRGFIFAGGVFQSTGITSFPFVMNTQCKFGPDGLAYCVILVELDEGVTTDFTTYPVTVEGKLSVRPFNSGGFTWSVYHLQGRRVF